MVRKAESSTLSSHPRLNVWPLSARLGPYLSKEKEKDLPKFEKPTPTFNIETYLEDFQKDFWDKHRLIDTKFEIWLRAWYDFNPEYGSGTTVPAKMLYGPYDTAEEAQEHVDYINGDKSLKPKEADLFVKRTQLVETTVVTRFWI